MNEQNFALADRQVLVTGAGGFIGSHLTEALLETGARVRALVHYNSRRHAGWLSCLSHKNLEITFADVRDRSLVERSCTGCSAVFHLAALIGIPYSYTAAQSYIDTNLQGTLNILEAALSQQVERIVLTSTSEVYGTARFTPMNESHPLQAQSPYAASKIAADMLGLSYSASFKLPVVLVRPFNTFGPRQSMRAVIPTIIVQALRAKQVQLGNLAPIRDFNFVKDTAAGFIAAAENGCSGEVYNLATGYGNSIKSTAEEIIRLTGTKAELICSQNRVRPQGSEVEELIGDASKAMNELNWRPHHNFSAALKQTIDWISANLDLFPETEKYVE